MLLVCCYNLYKSFSIDSLTVISKKIDSLSSRHENFLIIGDFNCEICEESMSNFYQINDFKNLINNPKCYKIPEIPTCIDVITTNKPNFFFKFYHN